MWCIYLYLRSFDLDHWTSTDQSQTRSRSEPMVTTELTVSAAPAGIGGVYSGGATGALVLGVDGLLNDVESGGAFESDL